MEPSTATRPTAPSGEAPPPPAPEAGAPRQPKRKLRNYLLDTGMQLKLASYLLACAVALSLGLGWQRGGK